MNARFAHAISPTALVLLALLIAAPLRADDPPADAETTAAAADGAESEADALPEPESDAEITGIAYEVDFTGVDDGDLLKVLRSVSLAESLKNRPPPTLGLLRRRLTDDVARLQKALQAYGYFAGEVSVDMDVSQEPVVGTFQIAPGPVYRIADISVAYSGTAPELSQDLPPDWNLRVGDPWRSAALRPALDAMQQNLRHQGYPRPRVVDRSVRVEHSDQTVHVELVFRAGPKGYLRHTTFKGLTTVEEAYLRRIMPWIEGTPYDVMLLEDYRDRLTEARLFDLIRIEQDVVRERPRDEEDDDGTDSLDAAEDDGDRSAVPVDVEVIVEESLMRTVYAGLGYDTIQTVYLRGGWSHRNFLSQGESLGLDFTVSPIEVDANLEFRKPAFLLANQELILDLNISRDDFDAYRSNAIEAGQRIERQVTDTWAVGIGLGQRLSDVEQLGETETFLLLKLPLALTYDGRDDKLNSASGLRWHTDVTPTMDLLGNSDPYVKMLTELRYYIPLDDDAKWVLATRLEIGSIVGADHSSVPADDRFYAGGGSSLRAYGFQEVGPYVDDTNVGGLSLLETGVELRWQTWENVGLVTFVDGGAAFRESYPDFSEELRWGAGVGLRYFTFFGPIRFDLAVPLNPDTDHHSDFQFYISIGQAF